MMFVASYSFSQSANDYKAFIIPMKYDFQKTENQYRMQTITKANLKKANMTGFYAAETIPLEFSERCGVLYVDVISESGFLTTKLFITFKDCYGKIVFQSQVGKSKQKDYTEAYTEALNDAFQSVYELRYNYTGGMSAYQKSLSGKTPNADATEVPPSKTMGAMVPEPRANKPENGGMKKDLNMLYAQKTPFGYQLIDGDPKVIMKLYKTSNPSVYMAKKGAIQGVLLSKADDYFFEYYQEENLISEKLDVKF
jgi:hypothetical protein